MSLIYNLEYTTNTHYKEVVKEAVFEFAILPQNNDTQMLQKMQIDIIPNVEYKEIKNHFGINILSVSINKPFEYFEFRSNCEVIKQKGLMDITNILTVADERSYISSIEFKVDNYLFLQNSDFTAINKNALNFLDIIKADEPLIEYLQRLNKFIYSNFDFCDKSTTIFTKAQDILEIKKGVCQDFAHLFIGICRAQGIAARYTSGYLHQGHGFHGDAFLHAWVEAFVPNLGWVGLDPTNDLLADEHYIKIAHGVDYFDCAPIKGALKYAGDMQTEYSVSVKLKMEQVNS